MARLKSKNILAALLIVMFFIFGCSLSGTGKSSLSSSKVENIRTGSDGISMSFLPNAPPEKIVVTDSAAADRYNNFDVILELKNKGAYPQPEDGGGLSLAGKIYLGGYDQNIIEFVPYMADLKEKTLEGKSTINPNGGSDLVTFKGKIVVGKLNVEKYEPTLLATACYVYRTVAGPTVCIDPDPYSTIKEKKVCTVQPITLKDQGAPIAITRIDEEAFATKTQFRITIKNVGKGDAFKADLYERCNPYPDSQNPPKLGRNDIDKVFLYNVKIRDKDLNCGPYAERREGYDTVTGPSGFVRLINGEGSIICEMPSTDYGGSNTAFTTPINIILLYGYRSTLDRKITINKETSGLSGSSSTGEGTKTA